MTRFLAPLAIGILGTAVLVSLGIWQVQRLAWKEAALATIEARVAAEPEALPAAPDPDRDRYLPVQVEGTFKGASLHVLTGVPAFGSGYRVISALTLGDGREVLVDRGFAPLEARPSLARPTRRAMVTGNLAWPDEADAFTPEPDRADFLWFARDVEAIAAELGTEPVLIVAREIVPADGDLTPAPVSTEGIPNDHLEYAITWFGLAAVWSGMTLMWFVRLRRGRS